MKQIEKLFQKELTRKEFLQEVLKAVLVLVGVTGIVTALTADDHKSNGSGYGSSSYGGR